MTISIGSGQFNHIAESAVEGFRIEGAQAAPVVEGHLAEKDPAAGLVEIDADKRDALGKLRGEGLHLLEPFRLRRGHFRIGVSVAHRDVVPSGVEKVEAGLLSGGVPVRRDEQKLRLPADNIQLYNILGETFIEDEGNEISFLVNGKERLVLRVTKVTKSQ